MLDGVLDYASAKENRHDISLFSLLAIGTHVFRYQEGESMNRHEDSIEARADVNRKLDMVLSAEKPNLEEITALIKAGANVNATTEYGETLLFRMVGNVNPNLEVITALLKAGAEVNATTRYGFTPLMNATYTNTPNLEVITTLIKAGANVNATDKFGNTSLRLVMSSGNPNPEVIATLIKAGAKEQAYDN